MKGGRAVGSRAEVMHGTADHTSGGLKKSNLKYNKHGKIVSRKKSSKGAMLLKRLTSKGYFTRKGKFGYVKKVKGRSSGTRKHKSRRRVLSWNKREDRWSGSGEFAKKPSYRRRRR